MARTLVKNGRELARQVLRRVRQDGAYANLALSGELARARSLDLVEKHLATELIYGVLRQQRLLDHALARHARRSLARLGPEALDALRLAAYQILRLDRVPAHAAVNDAVSVVRRARGPEVAGFANAVLRKLRPEDLVTDLPADPLARLAIEGSLPEALVRRWAAQLGLEETRALAACLLGRSPLTVRVNALKTDRDALEARLTGEGARVQRCPRAPRGLQLSGLPEPFAAASYHEGLWTAQDEAAQLVGHLLDPPPGERVLDACAGVGGKTTHLADLGGDGGQVVAVDVSPRKIELLREHCLRLGVGSCVARVADLRRPEALGGERFGRVLLDAPCSGLGVLGRHPELRWRLELEKIPRLVALQRELLETAVAALAPGGVLVYSVCTTTEEEGPEQVRWLRERFPELAPLPATTGPLADLDEGGSYRLWPHRHGTDGFFMARFRRRR